MRRGFAFPLGLVLGAAIIAAGCGPDRTQSVRPQLVPPLDVHDFGEVPVLNERQLEIPLLNVGRGALTVNRVEVKESDVPFRLLGAPEEVGASEEKPVVVVFVPPLEGPWQATLVLETDDLENPTLEVTLKGVGSTRAVMELEPEELDFGRVAEGTSAVRSFVIRSAGTADLILEDLSFMPGSSDAFGFVGSATTPATVPHLEENGLPGQIQLTVRFTAVPGGPEEANGSIHVAGTDPDRREAIIPVRARINRAPVAIIQPLGVGAPGMEIALDGSASFDPDGDDPISYKWTIRSKPLGATTTIEGPEQPVTRMFLDATLPGEYVVELQVTDAEGARSLEVARASVVAAPAQKLLVELFWNNTKTDVDLHFLRSPQTVMGTAPNDCFYQNPNPDWGEAGNPDDDPALVRDALTGYGPEVVGYVNPPDNHTFRVIAELYNTNLLQPPASRSEVTVRIYLYGVLRFESKRTLEQAGQIWGVADIQWPSGIITPLQ